MSTKDKTVRVNFEMDDEVYFLIKSFCFHQRISVRDFFIGLFDADERDAVNQLRCCRGYIEGWRQTKAEIKKQIDIED